MVVTVGKALIITILLEFFALLLQKEKRLKIYIVSFTMNIFTNLSLNLFIQTINLQFYDYIVFGLEVLIIFVESIGYYFVTKKKGEAFRISCICNLISYFIGLLFMAYLY